MYLFGFVYKTFDFEPSFVIYSPLPKTEFMGGTFKNRPNLFTLIMSDGKDKEFKKALTDKKAFVDYARIIVKSNVLHNYEDANINQKIASASNPKYENLLKHIWYNRFSYMTVDELSRPATIDQMVKYQQSNPKNPYYNDRTRQLLHRAKERGKLIEERKKLEQGLTERVKEAKKGKGLKKTSDIIHLPGTVEELGDRLRVYFRVKWQGILT